ncbi:MAG: hydroxyacid dehydrogenase [Clostridia bacterium]|nr:hydroxyacid dehydrogenase [Clostridia bacterium]
MKITVLDADSIGRDIELTAFNALGEVTVYAATSPEELPAHAAGADVLVLNKVKVNATTLPDPAGVRLICLAATGTDNVDIAFCRQHGIGVCNVVGYSTDSVAQLTVAMVLSLVNHLPVYTGFVASGEYSASGVPTRLEPVFHELRGKTWGIVGCGNIGAQVAAVARAFGCRVVAFKRTPTPDYECVDLPTLCAESDIITVHLPLTDATRHIIGAEELALMKPGAVLVNVARGAVLDEAAVAAAVAENRLGGFGCDVYSMEPMPADHPYAAIAGRADVCLTPHMGWGAYEARLRVVEEIAENIRTFATGGTRCRVDL